MQPLKVPGHLPVIILQTNNKNIQWAEALSLLYLVAPVFLFFACFVRIAIAIPTCLFIAICITDIVRRTEWSAISRVSRETLWALAFAAIWLCLAGNLGDLRQNFDWIKHYALLNYLAAHPWPATIHVDGLEGEWAVRYSVGWYLVPAFILKWTDPHAQRLVSGLWSLVGIFLFFRMLNSLITTKRAAVIVPLVFIVFSGADFVGTAITHFQVGLIYHIEWWAGWIEYASNMTSLFWVPQHAIAVWLGVAILMLQAKRPTLLPYLALAFSAICLWSPFAAIGLAPFALLLAWRNGIREIVFGWRPIVALVLVALPTMLYLTNSAGQIPHGLIGTSANRCVWSESAGAPCFSWTSYFLFVAIEFAVPGIILLFAKRNSRAILLVALSSLVLIPLYKAGAYNDFGMRVSMAGLAVLAILAGELIVTGPRLAAAAMIVALALGLPTSVGEVARAFTDVPGVDINSSLEKSLNDHPEVLPQYFARLPISVLRASKEAPSARAQN